MFFKPLAFLAAGTIAALIAAGCTKGSDQSSTSSTSTTTTTQSSAPAVSTAATAAASGQGDAAHGKSVFATNCAGCHGANGEGGGIGPTLKNEKSRKNFVQTIAQIKHPQKPMPQLYPGTLSEQDVNDVAAFVQTL
jgi:mono/diheme cytochrome c family protein